MTTNNTSSSLDGCLTVSSSGLTTNSDILINAGSYGYNPNMTVFYSPSNNLTTYFPAFIKSEEVEEGLNYLFAVPSCGKENVSVTYLEQDSFFKVEADIEFFSESRPCKIKVNTDKLDLSLIECSVKNGLLKVFVPYFEDAIPKSVKVS
jgi:HSP20 family molecular chaperone IbpA